jgi:hypothetical protein
MAVAFTLVVLFSLDGKTNVDDSLKRPPKIDIALSLEDLQIGILFWLRSLSEALRVTWGSIFREEKPSVDK